MLSQANQRKSWYSKSNNNRAVEIILAYQHNFIYNFFCNLCSSKKTNDGINSTYTYYF